MDSSRCGAPIAQHGFRVFESGESIAHSGISGKVVCQLKCRGGPGHRRDFALPGTLERVLRLCSSFEEWIQTH
jgi:hypothetical protein